MSSPRKVYLYQYVYKVERDDWMKLIAADASSLILLTRIDLMALVIEEFQVIIPESVYKECVNEETLKRFPDALAIQQWVHDKKLKVKKVDAHKHKFVYKVNQGEREAIALSLEYPESILLTDDGNAVKIAKYLKKPFIISPLVVLDFYRLEKISHETARKSIEKLSIIGRYLPNLIADVFVMLESVKREKERK